MKKILAQQNLPLSGAGAGATLTSNQFTISDATTDFGLAVQYTPDSEDGLLWYLEYWDAENGDWYEISGLTSFGGGVDVPLVYSGNWSKSGITGTARRIYLFPAIMPGDYRIQVYADNPPVANSGTVKMSWVEVKF